MLNKRLNSMEEIQSLEKVSPRVSDKYVPMKTSALVNQLQPEYTFSHGSKFRPGSSGHYVIMTKGESIDLMIVNSFDRSAALSMRFNYNGFIFGNIRQVHMGESAKELIGSADEIASWYKNAQRTLNSLQTYKMPEKDLKIIADIVFKTRGVKDKVVNVNYNQKNTLDFILHLISGIQSGTFIKETKRGLKVVRELKNQKKLIKINYRIWKYLEENNPELYI